MYLYSIWTFQYSSSSVMDFQANVFDNMMWCHHNKCAAISQRMCWHIVNRMWCHHSRCATTPDVMPYHTGCAEITPDVMPSDRIPTLQIATDCNLISYFLWNRSLKFSSPASIQTFNAWTPWWSDWMDLPRPTCLQHERLHDQTDWTYHVQLVSIPIRIDTVRSRLFRFVAIRVLSTSQLITINEFVWYLWFLIGQTWLAVHNLQLFRWCRV